MQPGYRAARRSANAAWWAGMVGFAGHLTIADDVSITGCSLVSASIKQAGSYSSGMPTVETRAWRRMDRAFTTIRRKGAMMEEAFRMDIGEIMQQLPHRYPFLLVDRILACEAGKYVHALKNVTVNEPFFQGALPAPAGDAGCAHHRGAGAGVGHLGIPHGGYRARQGHAVLLRGHRQGALPQARRARRPAHPQGKR